MKRTTTDGRTVYTIDYCGSCRLNTAGQHETKCGFETLYYITRQKNVLKRQFLNEDSKTLK